MTTNNMSEDVEINIRKLLNKIRHPNFDEVLEDFLNIQVDNMDNLANLVFNMMLSMLNREPTRASVFARLISRLCCRKFNLRRPLFARCKQEFKLCVQNMVYAPGYYSESSIDKSELDGFKSNTRLFGELYNCHKLSHTKIMQSVDIILLGHDDLSVAILCILVRTIGRQLDKMVKEFTEETDLSKLSRSRLDKNMAFVQSVENLFDNLTTRSNSGSLSLHSITAIKEILQLRKNNWKMDEVALTAVRSKSNANFKVANNENVELTIQQMLNKLSDSNFDKVLEDFTATYDLDGDDDLINLVANVMISKVGRKPESAGVFARLVSRSGRSSKLRKAILNRCQIEFKSILVNVDNIKESENNLFGNVNSDEFKSKFIRLSAGHIRLIGELYNYSMLGQNTIMRCVNDLLKRHVDVSVTILCALIKTIGPKLDNRIKQFKTADQTKVNLLDLKENAELVDWIETLFRDLEARISSGFLPLNSKTSVQEILQFRANNWETGQVQTTSKLGDTVNLNVETNGVNLVRLNNTLESSNISETSSRMSSTSPNSEALKEDGFVSKSFAKLPKAMSSVNWTPDLVMEKEKPYYAMKAHLEKSTADPISSTSEESSMVICEGTCTNPGTPRSLNSIEDRSKIMQSSSPQLKYLSIYINWDRMLNQLHPKVVEDLNKEISAIIFKQFQHHQELESFSTTQNDFENDTSSFPPQLKYLTMYANYDKMLKQIPPNLVEDINMIICIDIYKRLKG